MTFIDDSIVIKELETLYTEDYLISIGMKPISCANIASRIFEKNEKVYYFDETEERLLQLFLVTNKRSFYL